MSRRIVLSCIFLALMGTTVRAQIPISRDLLPTRTALGRVGLERNWMAAVPMEPTEKLLEISMADNLIFAQTDHAGFHTFDSESGRLLWSAHLGRQLRDAFPASVNSRLVFVTNSNLLYALDRHTGRTVWVENLSVLPSSPTACDEGQVMVGLSTGMLRSFSLYLKDAKGVVVKDAKGQPVLSPQALFASNWQTSGPLKSRPIPAGRMVVFGGHDGRAYVALTDTPKMLYRIATGGAIEAPISFFGARTFLIPSADQNVYSVDLFTATVMWTFSAGAPVLQEPLVADRDVYVVNTSGVLNAVDIGKGSARWSTSTHGGRLMAVTEKRIYLESYDEDLFIVDRESGRIVADPRSTYTRAGVNLRSYDLSLTNTINDRLYLASSTGLIFSLREIGQTKPRLLRDPKAPKFGSIPPEGVPMEPPSGITAPSILDLHVPADEAKPAAAPDGEPDPAPEEK
ncbi:Outer membrane protein assembly factor BamB, contains PQQ-like beta-propeller repeat [Singulisphaera sp. GP187]|uniref:outer membrane protein assembly factor BamB family protein n=1 Tax=Singulisphaera sp. GP187 TaxID=1882752 RepID=UPI0009267A15|nr:PQQ-binding-like beta-propeller repeat protein [Singulisphaera sp. GP187]SIO18585.1 Outer membrane protein assembly factor BamB, contains PQQ-like beta-propeller repeat [Singulisphaera sp. GP187]